MKEQRDHSWRKIEEFIHVQDLNKLAQKQVEEASMPYLCRFRVIATDASNSPFSEDILEYEFLKKLVIMIFYCYFGQSDLVQHLRKYQDKMMIYSRNNSILCRIFPSSLKGVDSDWFYSFPPHSIHGFRDLTNLLLTQYSSRLEPPLH